MFNCTNSMQITNSFFFCMLKFLINTLEWVTLTFVIFRNQTEELIVYTTFKNFIKNNTQRV